MSNHHIHMDMATYDFLQYPQVIIQVSFSPFETGKIMVFKGFLHSRNPPYSYPQNAGDSSALLN